MRHLLTANSFVRKDVERWFRRAEWLRGLPRLELMARHQGAVVATLFYEPSTRTRMSFEAAAVRLGARVVSSENARENSSAKKGERLTDVFRVVGSYADAIVIRHHEEHAIAEAAPYSPVPVINAGSGSGEHPTQALLDVYTMWRECGSVDGLTVTLLGDLKYGRTVHSLLPLLSLFEEVKVRVCHPDSLGLPIGLAAQLKEYGLPVERVRDVREALQDADVIYQTRVQRERLIDEREASQAADYRLGVDHLADLKPTARILHPLPRVDELSPEIDKDPRAAYFRQVENGMYLRMALLDEWLPNFAQDEAGMEVEPTALDFESPSFGFSEVHA
ncbi:MAG: aspartate carbamoyltransferase [Alicyclobacillus herbarius]|uniref:aspartate carbamoyltransferase n=1 Tax=Alicyclobacillus herbarius TaxID=122960 RepID=UPI0003FC52CC|nr:aspartate carbamoyltransferase [Alicyclobacillus herbarius]MCL6631666.1 aspartate carbamoyltransferase [Alicyclobacillus herbarius]